MYKVYSRTQFSVNSCNFLCIKLYKDKQMSILKVCEMETKRVVFGQSITNKVLLPF